MTLSRKLHLAQTYHAVSKRLLAPRPIHLPASTTITTTSRPPYDPIRTAVNLLPLRFKAVLPHRLQVLRQLPLYDENRTIGVLAGL